MDWLPIGGLLCKIAASVVLSQGEWTEDEETRSRAGYHKDPYRWSSPASCRRYVDDLKVVSQMWCFTCLAERIPHVFTVHFDVEPQSAELIWLDLRVVLESGEILAKAERGESAPFASDFNLLEAFIIGRMKRREEFTPPTSKCVGEACDLMCDVL